MDILNNGKIKSWCKNIEESALAQVENIANFPHLFNYAALMPDCHTGAGVPIGSILPVKNVIIPNAVGVDIGCGMSAVKLNLNIEQLPIDKLKAILGNMRKAIPVGFDHHKHAQSWEGFDLAPDIKIIKQELTSARKQLGTLGGGNHFIEIQKDGNNNIWVMIHSGSRNFGYKIAEVYGKIAREESNYGHHLDYLILDSYLGHEYFTAMNYACEFSFANREHMMNNITNIFKDHFSEINITIEESYNIHHNYANIETHFGAEVVVHRKGATSAKLNEFGIIPGSQGTCSYIVRGLGNSESYQSCSHGAGRVLSRTKAKESLNLDMEIAELNKKNILHSIRYKRDLEESPNAYKNIDTVMEQQADLIEIVYKLEPLAVLKG